MAVRVSMAKWRRLSVYVDDVSAEVEVERSRRSTRLMPVRGVAVGLIGGKRDWKMVVVRFSRCLGIC